MPYTVVDQWAILCMTLLTFITLGTLALLLTMSMTLQQLRWAFLALRWAFLAFTTLALGTLTLLMTMSMTLATMVNTMVNEFAEDANGKLN